MSRIELHQRDAVHNFSVGAPIHLTWSSDGRLRVATRWERALQRLRNGWRRATWWRHARYQVSDIDVAGGVVTVARMLWSWRRWRWEVA